MWWYETRRGVLPIRRARVVVTVERLSGARVTCTCHVASRRTLESESSKAHFECFKSALCYCHDFNIYALT